MSYSDFELVLGVMTSGDVTELEELAALDESFL